MKNTKKIKEITFLNVNNENIVAEIKVIETPTENFVTTAYKVIAKHFDLSVQQARSMYNIK